MIDKKNGHGAPECTTTHRLAFEIATWWRTNEYLLFRVGTCEGAWRSTSTTYDILSIDNEHSGNGHFTDVMEWFEHCCRRDGKQLRFLEVLNDRLRRHLIEKRGFTAVGDHCVKQFK